MWHSYLGCGDPDGAKCAGTQIALATGVIIYKRTLRDPMKENTLVLIAVTTGHKNTRSRTRLESELPPQQIQRPEWCWRAD